MALKEPLGGKERPTNLTELRERISHVVQALCADAIPLDKAKEISNAAGKIIKSVTAQVEYAHARKESPDIPWAK